MRPAFWLFAFGAVILRANAGEFSRSSHFKTITSFVAAVESFEPAHAKSDLAALFTVAEAEREPDDPKTGKLVTASAIKSSVSLWSFDNQALVFATAEPPTESTRSSVGVLFLLVRQGGHWRIGDLKRFTADGKYADVSAEVTGGAGHGYPNDKPFITVKESHGGRGFSFVAYATYTINSFRLQRFELK